MRELRMHKDVNELNSRVNELFIAKGRHVAVLISAGQKEDKEWGYGWAREYSLPFHSCMLAEGGLRILRGPTQSKPVLAHFSQESPPSPSGGVRNAEGGTGK